MASYDVASNTCQALFRGHGCSENPRDVGAVSITSMADDMECVMRDVSARGLVGRFRLTL
jgi:hypothetical protein